MATVNSALSMCVTYSKHDHKIVRLRKSKDFPTPYLGLCRAYVGARLRQMCWQKVHHRVADVWGAFISQEDAVTCLGLSSSGWVLITSLVHLHILYR